MVAKKAPNVAELSITCSLKVMDVGLQKIYDHRIHTEGTMFVIHTAQAAVLKQRGLC